MKAKLYLENNEILNISVDCITRENGVIEARISKEKLPSKVNQIDFLYDCFVSNVGSEGYFIVPREPEKGTIITYFKERQDAEYISTYIHMGCYGFCQGNKSTFAIITGMRCDCGLVERCTNGVYSLFPRFYIDGDISDEDIVVELYPINSNDYSKMAECYRNYQLTSGGCVSLKERIKNRPELLKIANSINVRVRMGWKPAPSPVLFQTLETEPDMHVACSFERVGKIADMANSIGIDGIEFCLVGWNKSGHDGRYPQIFPVEPKLGGEEKLVELINHLNNLGYGIVGHTNSTEAYTIADCWNDEYLIKKKDCSVVTHDVWSGGQPFKTCPKRVIEEFDKPNLSRMAKLGFNGAHYVDVITNVPLPKCYDKRHPCSRTESAKKYRELLNVSKKLFGGVASEGGFDFAASDLDCVIYTSFELGGEKDALCDDFIPFFQLVYHGIIMYNPATYTLNYPVKGVDNRLKFFEYGGRPLAVFNANFSTTRSWMGKEDLFCNSDAEMQNSIKALKMMSDDYKLLEEVRFSFMEKHEKISDGVYGTTYSNGIKVVVNYNEKSVKVGEKPTLFL